MFRVNSNKDNFLKNLCDLNDTSLLAMVQLVSSSIDFNLVRLKVSNFRIKKTNFKNEVFKKVADNTSLANPLFFLQIGQGLTAFQDIVQVNLDVLKDLFEANFFFFFI